MRYIPLNIKKNPAAFPRRKELFVSRRKKPQPPGLVTLAGIVRRVRFVQAENAPFPMLVTLLPMVTLVRLVQPANARGPDAGDAVGDRDAGQAGAAMRTHQPPMLVTLLGIVTLVRLVQYRNAPPPMLVTLLGIVT